MNSIDSHQASPAHWMDLTIGSALSSCYTDVLLLFQTPPHGNWCHHTQHFQALWTKIVWFLSWFVLPHPGTKSVIRPHNSIFPVLKLRKTHMYQMYLMCSIPEVPQPDPHPFSANASPDCHVLPASNSHPAENFRISRRSMRLLCFPASSSDIDLLPLHKIIRKEFPALQ